MSTAMRMMIVDQQRSDHYGHWKDEYTAKDSPHTDLATLSALPHLVTGVGHGDVEEGLEGLHGSLVLL